MSDKRPQTNWVMLTVGRLLGVAGLMYAGTVATAEGWAWTLVLGTLWASWTYLALSEVVKKEKVTKGYLIGVSILTSMLSAGWIWALIGFLRYML